ncbi:MAG: hypothetical protein Q7S50_02085 [bacterium]|nr:hypothetical protein [bacterium]
MNKITIPKDEYQALKRQSKAYRQLAGRLFEVVVHDDVGIVIEDFAKTKLYSKEFLADLEKGLRRSSYGKA